VSTVRQTALLNNCQIQSMLTKDAFSSLSRCLFSSPSQPVYFCDVITADVLTSFAKVLGDIWISTIVLLPGGSLKMTFMGDRLSDIAIPVLMRCAQNCF
jgi:hypothetical protein